jgi:CDP-6-deoxy-D-xylo-4-hexulose-3-dehydrase
MQKISLVKDTIDSNDISRLVSWLKTNPRLTKGDLTIEFEKKWSEWLGIKYSVFVNSGSSANLAMIYALILSKKLKNNKIIVPSVSWVTTISPIIQLGLTPILCECDKDTLGLDIDCLENLLKTERPSVVMLVHVLGFPNKMNEIKDLCEKYDVIVIEDSCESVGSTYYGKKTGTFGLMSSFSFYFGHHISTIEGGMISTDDEELYNILLSIRSHGWTRDLEKSTQDELLKQWDVDDFKKMYTFIYPGFNLRSTDLQAFIGIEQMKKLDYICYKRNKNYNIYNAIIKNNLCKIIDYDHVFVSNFAYPIISYDIKNIIKDLADNRIETRPLVAGNIGLQPFWINLFGKINFEFADLINNYGIYLPNNHEMTFEQIEYICNIINKY